MVQHNAVKIVFCRYGLNWQDFRTSMIGYCTYGITAQVCIDCLCFNHYVLKAEGMFVAFLCKHNPLFRNLHSWFQLHLSYLCFESPETQGLRIWCYLEHKSCLQDTAYLQAAVYLTVLTKNCSFQLCSFCLFLVWNSEVVPLSLSIKMWMNWLNVNFHFSQVLYIHITTLEAITCCVRKQGCKHMLMWKRDWTLKQKNVDV